MTRIVASRCQVDLMKIRSEFKKRHGRSLYRAINVSASNPVARHQNERARHLGAVASIRVLRV